MKIHDKFVIELAEVIKGYGNDYQVNEPCKLPCDYKFYEISGVAICEESFKKMKRLEDEINAVLDEIRTRIESELLDYVIEEDGLYNSGLYRAIEVIDKYKSEKE